MKRLLVSIINFYQHYLSFERGLLAFFAPGGVCKYRISCSEYAKIAISQYGVVKGIILGVKRIWSCR